MAIWPAHSETPKSLYESAISQIEKIGSSGTAWKFSWASIHVVQDQNLARFFGLRPPSGSNKPCTESIK